MAHQADLDQASAHAASLQDLADDVERRVRAGDLARADALAARAETLAATAQQAEARQRLLAAQFALDAADRPSGAARNQRASAAASATLNPDHPELQQAARRPTSHASGWSEVKTSHRDPPELALRVISETPGRPDGAQTSIGVALRLPFGTDDRNLPLQAAALTELDLAETQERRLRERLESDLGAAQAAVLSAEAQEAAERARASAAARASPAHRQVVPCRRKPIARTAARAGRQRPGRCQPRPPDRRAGPGPRPTPTSLRTAAMNRSSTHRSGESEVILSPPCFFRCCHRSGRGSGRPRPQR